jgi:filamentous hemagglutinin family protein
VTLSIVLLTMPPTLAQLPLEADDTLGHEASQIFTTGVNQFEIGGGAVRGSNLFHSLRSLNVNDGGRVDFRNPPGIETILSRVTGNQPSYVLGTLGVLGDANLFLLNPNGIIFGPHAALDLRGSFLATTAQGFGFPDGSTFSAVNPQRPSLLAISVPVGLQYGARPGTILNQGRLIVGSGHSLVLVGGPVISDGGTLAVSDPLGGQISLGAVGGVGTVGLIGEGDRLALSVPANLLRSDILLRHGTTVDALVDSGRGAIIVESHNLTIDQNSSILAGVSGVTGVGLTIPGDIRLNLTNTLTLEGSVTNQVLLNAVGNAGNILIQTENFIALEEAQISASTFGRGDAGNIQINANNRVLIRGSDIFSDVGVFAVGNGGSLTITARDISLLDGAELTTSTFGWGNAGRIRIAAQDRLRLSGSGTNGDNPSAAFSEVVAGAVGQGGNITIAARVLQILDSAILGTNTAGVGNAGQIRIRGDRVTFSSSAVFSEVEAGAVGRGGDINLAARIVNILNGSELGASTSGLGNAGAIRIRGRDRVIFSSSDAFSDVAVDARGNGGRIEIDTPDLSVLNGTELTTSTFGQGNAGAIQMRGDRVTFSGSRAFSEVVAAGIGIGGDINITSREVNIQDESLLGVSTEGQGNAGTIRIQAGDRVRLSNSAVFSEVVEGATGNGGNIEIGTALLDLTHGTLSVQASSPDGGAGNIQITAQTVRLSHSNLNAATEFTPPGTTAANITLQGLEILLLDDQSLISARALGDANGGNISIEASEGFVVGNSGDNNDIIATAEAGDGGNITIRANRILGFVPQSNANLRFEQLRSLPSNDISASSEFGTQGTVTLDVLAADPTQGLTELPETLVDASDQIAQVCPTGPGASERLGRFVITGRGGIVPGPLDVMGGSEVEVDWVDGGFGEFSGFGGDQGEEEQETWIEAQGWVMDEDGRVHLVAWEVLLVIPDPPSCHLTESQCGRSLPDIRSR